MHQIDNQPFVTAHVPRATYGASSNFNSPTPSTVREIPARINQLDSELVIHQDLIDTLLNRLSPALSMRGSGSADNGPAHIEHSNTSLGGDLQICIGKVQHQSSILREAIDNLGI